MGFDRGTQRNSLGGLIISHGRGGDGVQTDPGWLLALLVLRVQEVPRTKPGADEGKMLH